MKLRSPWLIRLVAALLALALRAWIGTLRVRMVSFDGREHPVDPAGERYIYSLWHEGLLAPLARLKVRPQIRALISQHADGELIAQCCQRLGIGVVRGSSARGGSQALLEMIRGTDRVHLLITPDGPRGPRREIKSGMLMVAAQTGMPIIPIGIGFTSAWRAGSWDRFALPRPFSMLVGVVGAPISVPKDFDRRQFDEFKQLVNEQMQRVTQQAEDWAQRRRSGDTQAPAADDSSGALRKSA